MNTEKQKQSHSPRDLHRQNHCECTHSRSFRCWKCWNTMPISLLVHLYHNQLPLEPALITNDAQFNTGYKYYHTFFRKSKKTDVILRHHKIRNPIFPPTSHSVTEITDVGLAACCGNTSFELYIEHSQKWKRTIDLTCAEHQTSPFQYLAKHQRATDLVILRQCNHSYQTAASIAASPVRYAAPGCSWLSVPAVAWL